jgi:polysaccharide pyruvyl transferase CsaB
MDARDRDHVRVVVSGWSGSTNLGDELVLAGLLRLLGNAGVTDAAVLSVDPAATRRRFGVRAVELRPVGRTARLIADADLLIVGGGGLLQDETSPFNLPYHLVRPWWAHRQGVPVVGLGLGAGPLTRPGSRRLVGLLRTAVAVSVRDAPSRDLLATCGVRSEIGADLAVGLDIPTGAPEDVITVSLRPWTGGGGWLPVGLRRSQPTPTGHLDAIAAGLDAASERTGLPIRFVALQSDRDDEVHRAVGARLRVPWTAATPDVHDVVAEVGAGRLVVAMRYHAGVAATLAARPVALIGYSPKVAALAQELGPGAASVAWQPEALRGLGDAVTAVAGHEAAVATGRAALRVRRQVDVAVLDRALAAVRR